MLYKQTCQNTNMPVSTHSAFWIPHLDFASKKRASSEESNHQNAGLETSPMKSEGPHPQGLRKPWSSAIPRQNHSSQPTLMLLPFLSPASHHHVLTPHYEYHIALILHQPLQMYHLCIWGAVESRVVDGPTIPTVWQSSWKDPPWHTKRPRTAHGFSFVGPFTSRTSPPTLNSSSFRTRGVLR